MMKRLLFMLAFLVSFGFAAVGQESVDPGNEESQEQTSQNNQNPSTVDGITTVTLDGSQSLADLLGNQKDEVLYLKLVGPLTEADFTTMRGMSALKIIDMAGVTQLPLNKNNLQMIPSEAFGGDNPKRGLEKVIFPSCLEVIGSQAFRGCTNLSTADFSLTTQLKTIEYHSFYTCSGLLDINLSNCTSLQEIQNYAFSTCNGLRTVDLSNCSNLKEIKYAVFSSCSSLTTVNFENCSTLTVIGEHAFSDSRNISTVKLTGCTALSTIADCAFWNGSIVNESFDFDFTQLTALTSIGVNAFTGKALVGDIHFASQIHQLGESAFSNCKKITSISFADCSELTVISSNTFSNCDLLETVDFTGCSQLSTLQKNAFSYCPSLKRVIIDNSYYKTTDDVLFKLKVFENEYETLQLYPAGKTDASYTIPSTAQIISDNAFQYNTNLKEVTIPSNVLSIESNAFGCNTYSESAMNLKVIMESAQPIGLSGSIGLDNSIIFVPEEGLEAYKNAAVWKDYKIIKAGNSDLAEINLDGSQELAEALANQGIDLDLITQLKITGSIKINDFATLRKMSNLTQLDLGDATIENNEIPSSAFQKNNILLERIILPTSITAIREYAFTYCSNLTTINLSMLTNLQVIREGAFGGCNLTGNITFPEALTLISTNAFNNANFSSITLKSHETKLYEDNFTMTDKSTCELHVPYGSLTYYQNASYWEDFTNIIEEEAPVGDQLEITLTQMGSLENYLTIHEINVENVTELTISGPMDWRDIQQICTMKRLQKLNMLNAQIENDEIPRYSFSSNQTFLTEVVLPKDLQTIGYRAFAYLPRLQKVVLPVTLKTLAGFEYCSMLSDINIEDCTSLISIGGFTNCTSLPNTIVVPNTLEHIGSFSGSSITYIDLSQTKIESCNYDIFSDCELTGDWVFPETLVWMGEGTFYAAKFTSIKLRSLEKVNLNYSDEFRSVDLNTFKIYVPSSLVDTYKKDPNWYTYRNNIEGYGNVISAVPNDIHYGNVSGSGVYEQEEEVTLQATCNDWTHNYWGSYECGYLFVGWFEGENKLSENTTCRITADGQDHTYKAVFEQILFSNYNNRISIDNYDTKSITVSIDLSNAVNIFSGWYEDDVCISKDQTLTIQVKDGSRTRTIEPRFEGKTNSFGNTTISDANKVDGQDVSLYYNVRITGDATWKPNSIYMEMPYSSVLVESPIETSTINLNLGDTYNWRYIYLPYNLNVADIQCYNENDIASSQFVVRYYDGEERAKNGTGNSWKQLKKTDKLEVGKGYIFRTNDASYYKLNAASGMEALLTTKAVTIPLAKHESVAMPDANWNLIGNPFPCYFRTKSLFEQGGLDGTITVWDSNIQNYQYYTQDDDAYIAPLTAFFVQHDRASSVTFHPEGRAAKLPEGTTRSASALRSSDGRQVLNLVLSNDSLSDKTRIVFNEAAKAGYELGLDASKFRSMNPNAPAFYSIDADNQQLAINERPWDNGVVRLGCNFGVKGEYSIALQEAVEQDLILVDKVTGAQTNLKEQAYRFSAEVGESNDRFELRSGNPTGMEEIAGFQWQVHGGQLFLTGLPTNARVIVHDTMGRTVCDRTVSDELSGLALPQAGVYYLTIRTQQATRTERIMVKE